MRLAAFLAAAIIAATHTTTACAQAADTAVVRYEPGYFTQFQVSSALDMVRNVPGFSFNGGSNARGFAGTAGNVLIDGERPASKNGLGDTLGAITASQVERIELITGGAPGIDMLGYRQVVNVVRRADGKPSMTLSGDMTRVRGKTGSSADFTYSRNVRDVATDLRLSGYRYYDNNGNPTTRRVYKPDRASAVPDVSRIDRLGGGSGVEVKLSHSRPLFGGKLSLNGRYNPDDFQSDTSYNQAINPAVERYFSVDVGSDWGVQYARPLSAGFELELDALQRHGRGKGDNIYTNPTGSSRVLSRSQSDERIVSARLTWQATDTLDLSFAAESAFNGMHKASSYTPNVTVAAPFETTQVEEDRKEYSTSANWQVVPVLTIAAGVRVETSTLSVVEAHRAQDFVYAKPSLQILWAPNDRFKLTWKSERQVGQLNFGDFASSVSLDTAVIKAGNPDLVPQKQWHYATILDYVFWDKGALTLSLEHDDVEDVLDNMPIVTPSGVFNARGNIGDGTRDSFHTTVSLPLDRLWIEGGTLKVDAYTLRTNVVDPVLGIDRQMSGQAPFDYNVNFTQVLSAYNTSWGFVLDNVNSAPSYGATEFNDGKNRPVVRLWAEYKTAGNLTLNIEAQNLWPRFSESSRTVYGGLRGLTPIVRQDESFSYQQPTLTVRIRKEL